MEYSSTAYGSPYLVVLTIAADLRAPSTAQGPEGVGRAAAGCERAYASYSPEGSDSSCRTGTDIATSTLGPMAKLNCRREQKFGAFG